MLPGGSEELLELPDEFGMLRLDRLENRVGRHLIDADLVQGRDDLVERVIRERHELLLCHPVPVEVVLEEISPAFLIPLELSLIHI